MTGPADTSEAASIAALIAARHHQRAVERAKHHHAQAASPESEKLLIEAYVARLLAFDGHMSREADALFDLVAGRHPSSRERLEREVRPRLDARFGRLERLLAPLAAPDAPEAARAGAESALRTDLTDLRRLADCEALPAEHALRRAAAALHAAFEAATRGPLAASDVLLAEVSRRSPLSDWKLLVRALAAFHQGDDAECARQLAAMDPASAPSRLVPVLKALTDGGNRAELRGEAAQLAQQIGGDTRTLRTALLALDAAFERGKHGALLAATRDALALARRSRPELVPRLLQHVSVRGLLAHVPAERLRAAIGGPAPRDAYFYRLYARAAEERGHALLACAQWENFRRCALAEGWFAERSPEIAAVELRQAKLASQVAPLSRTEHEAFERSLDPLDRPPVGQGWPDAALLFERAAGSHPAPETFRSWVEWARVHGTEKSVERAALAWHGARPEDARALLILAELCERRGALHKALRFLERALSADRLNPEVSRARPRLLAAVAVRRLREHRWRLAAQALDELAHLPDPSGGRAAVLAALRWVMHLGAHDDRHLSARHDVERLVGDESTARALLDGVAGLCLASGAPAVGELRHGARPPAALADALAAGAELGLRLEPGREWLVALERDRRAHAALGSAQLRALAELSLRRDHGELAYALSGAGLALEDEGVRARFLLLRALSLPGFAAERAMDCLSGAAELARRHRQTDLLAEIAAARPLPLPDAALDTPALDALVRRERDARAYPKLSDYARGATPLCDCRDCRRQRTRAAQGRRGAGPRGDAAARLDEVLAELDEAARDDDFDLDDPSGLPSPELMALMLEAMQKCGTDVLDPEQLARREPALFERIARAMAEEEGDGDFVLPSFRVPRRRKNKKKRKRR